MVKNIVYQNICHLSGCFSRLWCGLLVIVQSGACREAGATLHLHPLSLWGFQDQRCVKMWCYTRN